MHDCAMIVVNMQGDDVEATLNRSDLAVVNAEMSVARC